MFLFRRKGKQPAQSAEDVDDDWDPQGLSSPSSFDCIPSTAERPTSYSDDLKQNLSPPEPSEEQLDVTLPSYTLNSMAPTSSIDTQSHKYSQASPQADALNSKSSPPTSGPPNPLPILNQLIILTRELNAFVDIHRARFKKEENFVSYECDKPLPNVDKATSFVTDHLAPFYAKLMLLCSHASYDFDPTTVQARNLDLAFKPLYGRICEVDRVMRAMVDPPPPLTPEERKSLRKRWNALTRSSQSFLAYHQYASQAETHIRKHLRELATWIEADDFTQLVGARR
jgi:hypothetical protein